MRRLALLGAAGTLSAVALGIFGGPTASAAPRTVQVTIRHSKFVPARFTVRRGETVRFVLTNTDPIDHEFILGDEAVQRRHELGTEAAHGQVPGEVSVPPRQVAETTYTFSHAGVALIGCHAPGHYNYGMRGWVLVY